MNVYSLKLVPWKWTPGGGVNYSGGQEGCVCVPVRVCVRKRERGGERK